MATFNGIFPADELVAAPCGVLSVASVITHTDRPDDARWVGGYTKSTIGSPTFRLLSGNNLDITDGELYDGSDMPREFDVVPFYVELEIKTTGAKIRNDDPRDILAKQIEAVTQKAIERELWEGLTARAEGNDNPYLRRPTDDKGAVVLTTGAVHPKRALAMLEGAISNSPTGGAGVIHMTRETASSIVGGGISYRDMPNNALLTSLGTPVIVGSGYTGTGPGTGGVTGATRWAYVTGPVTVHLGPAEPINDELKQGFDYRTNDSLVRAIRPVAVHFDTTIFYAAQITLPDVP